MSLRYVVRRLLQVFPAVLLILVVTFVVIHLAPGNPEYAFASPEESSPEFLASLREKWGLDHPITQQFGSYVSNVFTGDFGESYDGRQVTTVIGERVGATLLLVGSALAISLALGIGLGLMAARRPFRVSDVSISAGTVLAAGIPVFFIAQLAILTFAVHWRVFPLFGMTDPRAEYAGLDHWIDVAHHLLLPALVLAVAEVAVIARLTRTGLVEEMSKDYFRTARAKGVPENTILVHHALPNAILPVVTVIGSRVGLFLSGAAIIETMFAWPGLGLLMVESATSGNRPVLLGMVLLIGFSVVVVNFLTDLVYARIDPRVSYD